MLRLHEEGLVDSDVWKNLNENSMMFLGSKTGRNLLAGRPGPLSKRLLAEVEALSHLYPPDAAADQRPIISPRRRTMASMPLAICGSVASHM